MEVEVTSEEVVNSTGLFKRYKKLHELSHYVLVLNLDYDKYDDSDATYLVYHKDYDTVEYRSLVYPMAIRALIDLNNQLTKGLDDLSELNKAAKTAQIATVLSFTPNKNK